MPGPSAAMLSMQQRGQEVAQMVEDANGEQREYVPKVSTMFPIASNNGLQRESKQDKRALPLDIQVFNYNSDARHRSFDARQVHRSRYFTPVSVNENNLGRFEGANLVIKSDPNLQRLGAIRSSANTHYEVNNDYVEGRINARG